MGRGRAKAKQVKVARQLKYNGGGTDLDRLRNELGIGGQGGDALADGVDRDDGSADGADEDDDPDEDDPEDDTEPA